MGDIIETTGYGLDILEDLKKLGVSGNDLKYYFQTQKLKESLDKMKGDGEKEKIIQAKNKETTLTDEKKFREDVKKENRNNTSSTTNASTNYKRQDIQSLDKVHEFLCKEYEGHCQICGDTFAFDGKNTYQIKSLNVGKNRDVNRKGNTLSLCFQHHAIFERKFKSDDSFFNSIKSIDKLTLKDIDKKFELYDWVDKEDKDYIYKAFYRLNDNDEFIRDEVYFLPVDFFEEDEFIKMTKAHMIEFIEVWNEN